MIYISIIASAVLYRVGGMSYGTKWRDWGCPLVGWITLQFMLGVDAAWFIHVISAVLFWGTLTTYWDDITGKDNFYIHGFACGLAYFPYAIVLGCWWQLAVRCIALCVFMGGLNWAVHKFDVPKRDWIEELSRGAVLIATLPILLI